MAEIVYPPVIRFAVKMFRVLKMDIVVYGTERMPSTGGVVLVSNHIGYLDFILAGLTPWMTNRRLTRFMAKDAVFHHWLSGPLMRGMHHIPVDREAGGASLEHAVDALKAGEVVGVFPEATISQAFVVKQIKSGAVRMAAASGAPIVPLGLWGTHLLWTKNRKKELTKKGVAIRIVIGEPIHVAADDDLNEVTARLRTTMQALLDQAQALHPLTPNPPPDAWWLPVHLGGTAPTPERAHQMDVEELAARRAKRQAAGKA